MRILRISVFGLGCVGTVSAGCLACDRHEVVGVDPVPTKVDLINRGQSPIVETEVGVIIAATAKSGRLRATSDPSQAIRETELSFVCVGHQARPTAISTWDISDGFAKTSAKGSRVSISTTQSSFAAQSCQYDAQDRDSHFGGVLWEESRVCVWRLQQH